MKYFCLLTLGVVCTLSMLGAYTETEPNNSPGLANVIPQGGYVVEINGDLWGYGDIDWFKYWVNIFNSVTVSLEYYTDNSLYVLLWHGVGGGLDFAPFARLGWDPLNQPWLYQLNYTLGPSYQSDYQFLEVDSPFEDVPYPIYYRIKIINHTDPTFPVVLSGFNAVQNGSFVGVTWTTQSETGMSGYNILRGHSNELMMAQQVNLGLIPATNTSSQHVYNYPDTEVNLGDTYYYWLEAVEDDGTVEYFGSIMVVTHPPTDDPNPPAITQTMLNSAYPNPFTNFTTVSFEVDQKMDVNLEIYNLRGQKITTLFSGEADPGIHRYNWNAVDQFGRQLPHGIYLVRMTTRDHVYQKKMVLQ